jgi:hypothetical protein
MDTVALVLGIACFVGLAISVPIAISYSLDRNAHEGVDWFARRRVLRSGQAADAKVLSSELMVGKNVGGNHGGAYSIVYEVMPPGDAPFRKKATEVMYFSEARANLEVGRIVQVRFDPETQVVVLVRVSAESARAQADAERREREERLLRGG